MDSNDLGAGTSPARSEGVRVRDDDALLAISFEELVRRRLRPVVETLEDGRGDGSVYREVLDQVERALVGLALERTGGNQQRAARLLGISRNTVRAKRDGAPPAVDGNGNGNGRRPRGR